MRQFKNSIEHKPKTFKQQANICMELCRKLCLILKKTAKQIIIAMLFWIRPLEILWYKLLLQLELRQALVRSCQVFKDPKRVNSTGPLVTHLSAMCPSTATIISQNSFSFLNIICGQSCGAGKHADTFSVLSSFNADAEIDLIGAQVSVAIELFPT